MKQSHTDYYRHLQRLSARLGKQIPGPMKAFASLHNTTTAEGALDTKTKELIALGIAVTVRCNGCISYHVHDALKASASDEEIVETIGVAIMMGGGPSMVYGCEALEALEQFQGGGFRRLSAEGGAMELPEPLEERSQKSFDQAVEAVKWAHPRR